MGDLQDINMRWHVPNDVEIDFAKCLLDRYLMSELRAIQEHTEGVKIMERY